MGLVNGMIESQNFWWEFRFLSLLAKNTGFTVFFCADVAFRVAYFQNS